MLRYVLLIGLLLFSACDPVPETPARDELEASKVEVMEPLTGVPPSLRWGINKSGPISKVSTGTSFMGTVQPDMLVDELRQQIRRVVMFELMSIGRPMDKVEIRFDGEVQYAWTPPIGAKIYDLKAVLSHAIERPTVVVIQVQAAAGNDWSLIIEPK